MTGSVSRVVYVRLTVDYNGELGIFEIPEKNKVMYSVQYTTDYFVQ